MTPSLCCLFECWRCFSPPARWWLLDFNIALRNFSSPPPRPPRLLLLLTSSWSQWALLDLNCQLTPAQIPVGGTSTTISVGNAEPQLGTSRAQWAPLDLNREVGTAGPQPGSGVGTAGPQPGTSRAQWAPLNREPPEPSGHCWTSTGNLPSSVGTAGFQPPDRMPEYMPRSQIECQNRYKIECQNICQNRYNLDIKYIYINIIPKFLNHYIFLWYIYIWEFFTKYFRTAPYLIPLTAVVE